MERTISLPLKCRRSIVDRIQVSLLSNPCRVTFAIVIGHPNARAGSRLALSNPCMTPWMAGIPKHEYPLLCTEGCRVRCVWYMSGQEGRGKRFRDAPDPWFSSLQSPSVSFLWPRTAHIPLERGGAHIAGCGSEWAGVLKRWGWKW